MSGRGGSWCEAIPGQYLPGQKVGPGPVGSRSHETAVPDPDTRQTSRNLQREHQPPWSPSSLFNAKSQEVCDNFKHAAKLRLQLWSVLLILQDKSIDTLHAYLLGYWLCKKNFCMSTYKNCSLKCCFCKFCGISVKNPLIWCWVGLCSAQTQ